EAGVHAGGDGGAAELRVLNERRRKHDAPLLVERALGGAREDEALHPPPFLRQRVERGELTRDEVLPALRRIRSEAPVHARGHDDSLRERPAELGRKRETALVIDRVLVLAEKHSGTSLILPLRPTLN